MLPLARKRAKYHFHFPVLETLAACVDFSATVSGDGKQALGMTLLNLAIGRTSGAEDDEREGDDGSEVAGVGGEGGGDKTSPPPSKMAKIAKVVAVAAGITDV